MRRTGKGLGHVILALALVTASLTAVAVEEYEYDDRAGPSGGAMVVDAVFARPLLAAATLGGTAIFLVSLPFSALGGNVEEAAATLIRTPAEATFRRCLGCEMSRRGDER